MGILHRLARMRSKRAVGVAEAGARFAGRCGSHIDVDGFSQSMERTTRPTRAIAIDDNSQRDVLWSGIGGRSFSDGILLCPSCVITRTHHNCIVGLACSSRLFFWRACH